MTVTRLPSPTRGRRARLAAAGCVAALGAGLLTGCATGQVAETANEVTIVDSTAGKVGSIELETVAIQAPSGTAYSKGSTAPLILYLVNTGAQADALTNISSPAFTGGWRIVSTSGSSTAPVVGSTPSASLAPGSATTFGLQDLTPNGGKSQNVIVLQNLTQKLSPGSSVQMTFTFAQAGQTTLTVPVQVTDQPHDKTLSGQPSASGGE